MKTFLRIATLLLAAATFTPAAFAQESASLRLNTLLYGFHSFFYLGVNKGFYKEEGIDLTIGEGQGSGRAVQIVGAKSDTFGLADGGSVIAGVSKGAPIEAVMGIMNKSPYAVIVRSGAGIKTVKDLEGKTIAAATGEAGLTLFPAILQANKMKEDSVKFLRVDNAGKIIAMLEKRVDVILGGVENQALILEQKGTSVTSLMYSDIGANSQGLVILTNKEVAAKNPKLVQSFVRATQKSIAYAEQHLDESVAAVLKVKPDLDKDLTLKQLKAGLTLVRAVGGADQPLGWMNPVAWEQTLRMARDYQDVKTDMKATDVYTNKLVLAK